MSDQVDEIRCRLCATYFPETDRFCPNCREPRPDVHEDLLMASRLTGVPYEALLERAWTEVGFIRRRREADSEQSPAPPAEPEPPPSFFARLIARRDSATTGCLVLFGVIVFVAIAAVGFLAIRDNFGGDDASGNASRPTSRLVASPGPSPSHTSPGASGGPANGAGASGNEGGSPVETSEAGTPAVHVLILNPAVPAHFSDGTQVRLVASSLPATGDGTAIPSPGSRFVSHQVEVCSGSEPLRSSPDDWRIEMPDGARSQPGNPVTLPALQTVELAQQECNSGWITFEIPVNPDPAYIVLVNPDYEQIRFSWPG